MDQRVYDTNATLDLSADKQNIVRQLSDMFLGYSLVYIRAICEACLWNVNLCIDKLTEADADISEEQPPQHQSTKVLNNSQPLQKTCGAVPKSVSVSSAKSQSQELPEVYAHIYNDITKGYKVLVLMRGPPGSGKTHLAKSTVKKLMPGKDWKDFVFGADDYYFDYRGRYRYRVDQLENAHKYCQARAFEKMTLGYSPVFVDNTNHALWEMLPYVKTGVQNGYIIELMEPVTPWRNSAGKLALKNIHNVPKHKIQRMIERFEVVTTNDLLALLKETQYTVELPQLRTYPPPPAPESVLATEPEHQAHPPSPKSQPQTPTKTLQTTTETAQPNNDSEFVPLKTIIEPTTTLEIEMGDSQFPIPFDDLWPRFKYNVEKEEQYPESKEQQEVSFSKPLNPDAPSFLGGSFASSDMNKENDNINKQLFPCVSKTAWQAYEQEASNFWGVPVTTTSTTIAEPMALDESSSNNCGLLQLLKEGVKSINVPNKDKLTNEEEKEVIVELVRHCVGCENENESFIVLRHIYPNKPIVELWDLFVKCNGSIDWAVDILLKDEDSTVNLKDSEEPRDNCDNFDCYCNRPEMSPPPYTAISLTDVNVKPQRQRPARNRTPTSAQILEMKETFEKSFVLGEEHYSSHVNKIRNKRNATEETSNKQIFIDAQVQTEDYDENENDNNSEEGGEGSEVIEINLGENLIGQLSKIFISETLPLAAHEKYKCNVFMPKSMARELYVLWMESLYNQQEEQRQSLVKEDEEFARLLKNPKYQNLKQTPENIKELLDMEYAWMIYKTEQEQYDGVASKHPNDLASHLTRMKLSEIFPNIPRDTLLEIFAAHNNKFSETVDVLKNSIQPATVDHQISADVLIEKARQENEKLNEEEDNQEEIKDTNSKSFQKSKQSEFSIRQRSLSPDEAKRLALSEFEETRNYAVHHCQLRAECYQKAKEAIQRGNSGVAVYYSQIANLHKRKIDIYNHRAANCIMEVHDLTQNNPDFIDLHYLHVVEAVACLDIFVDRHIAKLRSIFRSYKYVFIITGRGLHSTGGVSMIKTRVKSRLKERNLKWSEVNPGLLKVKIFSASKYSKNL